MYLLAEATLFLRPINNSLRSGFRGVLSLLLEVQALYNATQNIFSIKSKN